MDSLAEVNDIVPLLIDGQETTSEPSIRFPVYSYENQKDAWLAESADATSAKLAADAAARAFKTWKHVSAVQRRGLLLRYADLIRAHTDYLVAVQRTETSASEMWCKKNISLATGLIEETAACITSLKGEVLQAEQSETLALSLVSPIGPVLVIAP